MKKNLLSLAVLTGLCVSLPAAATNGYWAHGYGPKSKSIAGACVAMSFGAMCAASNPASLSVVGNKMEIGAALFSPTRGFTADDNTEAAVIAPGEYESENQYFLIPHFAYNHMLDDVSSFGVAMFANGGMNTEYDSAVFARFSPPYPGYEEYQATSPTGIDLKQMFFVLSYSRQLNEQHSIGISPVIGFQAFSAEGLEPFKMFSLHPDKVTDNGTDTAVGGGLRLGWLWRAGEQLKIGASYQTKIYMTKFEDYEGLFAEEGNFDVPANMDLGFSYEFAPDWTFAFNFQRIWYSDVPAIGNDGNLEFKPGSTLLGTDDGLGFGWNDINVYKFGLQWQVDKEITLRAGYSYNTDVFDGDQALFNILAPATVKQHYTAGLGWKLDDDSELNVALMYAPKESVSGTNINTEQTGEVWMDQWEIEIGWGTRF